eukprot:4602754-Pyramimonas_sp.AAC.1
MRPPRPSPPTENKTPTSDHRSHRRGRATRRGPGLSRPAPAPSTDADASVEPEKSRGVTRAG